MLSLRDKNNRDNLKSWLEFYNKVLTDGYYYIGKNKLMLYDDDRKYIHEQIAQVKGELKNGSC